MKQGIHLGRKRPRALAAPNVLLLVLAVGTVVQSFRFFEARRVESEVQSELEALREEGGVEAREVLTGSLADLSPRLRAAAASGALEVFAPTALLHFVEAQLPEGVFVTTLSLDPSPPGTSILIEAVARSSAEVTELQRRMARSPLVAASSVLEERRRPGGDLALRLQVDLDEGRIR